MSAGAQAVERPASIAEAALMLREAGEAERSLHVRGGGSKLEWSPPAVTSELELSTAGLSRILEHNAGDFTAVVEAGLPLAELQAELSRHGQMLALDPPLGDPATATVGGAVATADSGPMRHRYGSPRDLVLGATVILSDGTVARSGGRVIKNVAGYDVAKLFTGSFGSLGLIATISLRLHPVPDTTSTVLARGEDAGALAAAATRLAALPLEAECLDVSWHEGSGQLLARFGGATAAERARTAVERIAGFGLGEAEVLEDDEGVWERQRAAQRCRQGAVVKVSALIGQLGGVLEAAAASGARAVCRAGLGLSWLSLPEAEGLADLGERLRRELPDAVLLPLDGAAAAAAVASSPPRAAAEVMHRLKARFDPAGIFPAVRWS